MDSFKEASGFCYHPSGAGSAGLLDIYVHHARNIHNICIYANQDVYAKFSLTCSPDEALSTRVVVGGGKNPQFQEGLLIKVTQPDAVLKCEIWMLSRVQNYMEDQLLGFALVPLSMVAAAAKGRLTQDFTLSSTDLFHSPAGTIQLTLSLDAPLPSDLAESSSITSEVVLLDPADYGRIEFPDVNIARENQEMVSEYFDIADHSRPSKPAAPFLHLRASSQSMEDYEMIVNSGDSSGSIQNSGNFTSSTTTTLSDDRNSTDSLEKKSREDSTNNSSSETNKISPETPTSKIRGGAIDNEKDAEASKDEEGKEQDKGGKMEVDSIFKSPLGNINLEAEQSAMQQQIIDMYMRSMQQFTESLAKMKLPMELGNPKSGDGGDVIQSENGKANSQKKKDGGRVFYGSRAFF